MCNSLSVCLFLYSTEMVSLRRTRDRRSKIMNLYYEGHDIDKISELPRDLITDILNCLTIKDITQMSVLSKKWYDIWSSHPILVLDRGFREGLNNQFDFKNIVEKIMFQHSGSILKFVLDISSLAPDELDINHWMQYVSNKGVKDATIENLSQSTYTLPSFLFNSGLSHLDINNCAFEMPIASTSFQNLVRLDLRKISFDSMLVCNYVIEAPRLLTMLLAYCQGLTFLNISAPRLLALHIIDSHFIEFSFLKGYPKLESLTIMSCDIIESYESWRKFTLRQIICSFPKLTSFWFNSPFFKFAVPEIFPKRLGTRLVNLLNLNIGLSFANEAQISAVIFLLNSAPQLHSIKIEHELAIHDDEISMIRVREHLTAPDCIGEDLMAIRKIKLKGFVNVANERLFMKLMLARCPSLVKVKVTPAGLIDQREIFFFILEVMKFPRTSPNVSIEL